MTDANTYLDGEGIGRRDLLKRSAIGGGLVAAALAAPGFAGVAKAHDGKSEGSESIVLDVDTHGFGDFQGAAPGGSFYVSGDILAPGTATAIGTDKMGRFQCWGFIPADNPGPQDAVVNQEFAIDGRGRIIIAGLESDAPRAVTGGTGDFRSARGEGIPDVVIFDFFNEGKFRIAFNLTGVSPILTAPTESLMYGTSANRLGGAPLEGATISGNVFVWISPLRPDDVDAIRHVDFLINGEFRHREGLAPYDMIGGGDDAATASWNSREVSNGRTTATAVVVSKDGSTREVKAAFQVAN